MDDDSELPDINYNLILLVSDLTTTVIVVYDAFQWNQINSTKTWTELVGKTIDLFLWVKSLIEK